MRARCTFTAILLLVCSPQILAQAPTARATAPASTDVAPQPAMQAAVAQVEARERAFARSMADRDAQAFAGFVADDAVFFSGNGGTARGKPAVLKAWERFFSGTSAPFSWEPDQVQVLDTGRLALSTGPVLGPDGGVIARFNSIWRLDDDGMWRVVFDKGQPPDPTPE